MLYAPGLLAGVDDGKEVSGEILDGDAAKAFIILVEAESEFLLT